MESRRQETPLPPKRTTSDASRAATLFNRLQQLDTDEQAELAASPADIRAKFEARRERALAEASDDVRKLVEKMRAP